MSYPPANQPPYPPPPAYGGAYGGGGYGPPPANNLVLAILVTIFCCLPLGIVAIVYAAQVNSKWAMGDVEGARESARRARLFTIWSAVIGLLVIIGYVIWVVAIAGSGDYRFPTTT
jgi:hypothetical protein